MMRKGILGEIYKKKIRNKKPCGKLFPTNLTTVDNRGIFF
jgi:hypothetical protein